MLFGFSFGDLLLVGVAIAVLGPKDMAIVARTAGRLTGKAVAYVQKSRSHLGGIMERAQVNQVHNELRETMEQLEAIRHEIRTGLSIMNPGPMTREILNSAVGVRSRDLEPVRGAGPAGGSSPASYASATPSTTTNQPPQIQSPHFSVPEEMLKNTSFSDWVKNRPTPESSPLKGPVFGGNHPSNSSPPSPLSGAEADDIVVLPISALDAGLITKRKDGEITGSDIVLESVIEKKVAFQALDFFKQEGALK